jgi:hypothetical protein
MTTKYTKWPQNIPNDQKIYQMTTKYTKWPQNIPNDHKIYQMTTKYTKWPQNIPISQKIDILSIKYINIFHCKILKYLPKFEFLVWKYALPVFKPIFEPMEKFAPVEKFAPRQWCT